jgi:hypothetical protein
MNRMQYIFFELELATKDDNDFNIYAFINVSQIPTKKLVEIFRIDLKRDPFILEAYILTKTQFRKHKAYLEKEVGTMNLNKFEYCLRQYAGNKASDIVRKHKIKLFD